MGVIQILKLDKEYYVMADGRQFILNWKHKPAPPKDKSKTGADETDTTIGYYSDILHVINAYRKQRMLTWTKEEVTTLDQIAERLAELDETIMKRLKALREFPITDDVPKREPKENTKGK